MNDIRTVELFVGIGGFRLGLEQASPRFKVVYANDWKHAGAVWNQEKEKWCKWNPFQEKWETAPENQSWKIYTKHWNDGTYHDQDICTVDAADIPDCDLAVGGFPCQPFSMAGNRKGFSDFRGTLFFEIARILEAKRPQMLLLENVKGLLSAQNGFCFLAILDKLDELGYNVEWKVLNTKNWLPQNRERVFIVATLRGKCRRQVFCFSEAEGAFDEANDDGLQSADIARTLTATDAKQHGDGQYVLQVKRTRADGNHMIRLYDNQSPTLTSQMGTGGNNIPMVFADRTRSYAGLGRNLEAPKPISNTLSGVQKDNLLVLNHAPRCGNPQQGGTGPLFKENECFCIDSTPHYLLDKDIRVFTENESEALQGFPKGWTAGITRSQRYKCLGNAVSVPVIKYIGERILASFDDKTTREVKV